eukprot:PhF_6_TR13341/c0_g1_i1/m.21133
MKPHVLLLVYILYCHQCFCDGDVTIAPNNTNNTESPSSLTPEPLIPTPTPTSPSPSPSSSIPPTQEPIITVSPSPTTPLPTVVPSPTPASHGNALLCRFPEDSSLNGVQFCKNITMTMNTQVGCTFLNVTSSSITIRLQPPSAMETFLTSLSTNETFRKALSLLKDSVAFVNYTATESTNGTVGLSMESLIGVSVGVAVSLMVGFVFYWRSRALAMDDFGSRMSQELGRTIMERR